MPLEYGIAQHDGYKSPSEDFVAHIVCPNKYEIFGVFDGHNTNYYSKEASVRLPKILSDKFNHKILKFDYNKVSRVGKKETDEVIIMNY